MVLEEQACPFSKTAIIKLARLKSKPVVVRLALPNMVGVTRACTSARIGRVPSMVTTIAEPVAPSRRSSRKTSLGLRTSTKPCDCISKCRFRWWSQSGFDRPQDTEGVLSLALKIENGVHHVLQGPRSSQGAFLGHVPDDKGCDVVGLGNLHEFIGYFTDLTDRVR